MNERFARLLRLSQPATLPRTARDPGSSDACAPGAPDQEVKLAEPRSFGDPDFPPPDFEITRPGWHEA